MCQLHIKTKFEKYFYVNWWIILWEISCLTPGNKGEMVCNKKNYKIEPLTISELTCRYFLETIVLGSLANKLKMFNLQMEQQSCVKTITWLEALSPEWTIIRCPTGDQHLLFCKLYFGNILIGNSCLNKTKHQISHWIFLPFFHASDNLHNIWTDKKKYTVLWISEVVLCGSLPQRYSFSLKPATPLLHPAYSDVNNN